MADIFDTGEPVPVEPKVSGGPSQLVRKVRAKYPEYSDLSDDELESKVLAKYPEYIDLASNKAKMTFSTERSIAGAETGAAERTAAPGPRRLTAADFRRDEVPSEMPGSPGGPEARLSSMAVPIAGLGAYAAGPAIAPALPYLAKVGGAAVGGHQGYKRAGIPGAVAGAVAGAMRPGLTGTAAGVAEGYETGGVPGAVIGGTTAAVLGSEKTAAAAAVLLKKYGASTLTKLLATKFAPKILAEGTEAAASLSAAEAAALAKGANPEAVASIAKVLEEAGASPATARAVAASEAARGAASGAEASLQGLPGVVTRAGELSQEQLKMVMQLQAMAKQGGQSRQAVARAAKEMFPNNPEVIEMITGPITRMPSVSIPR